MCRQQLELVVQQTMNKWANLTYPNHKASTLHFSFTRACFEAGAAISTRTKERFRHTCTCTTSPENETTVAVVLAGEFMLPRKA